MPASTGPGSGARSPARPYGNPWLAGFLLGLVLLASFVIAGRGLGATAAYSALATAVAGLGGAARVAEHPVHARFWNDGAPLLSWTLFLLAGAAAGAFLSAWQGRRLAVVTERGPRVSARTRLLLAFAGGLLAAWGARLARGCTSGQALAGGAMLSVGGLVFMAAVFVAAYALAGRVRRQWL
ncbi:MAG: YeeE/YedE family protein [bacterium]|nr:YeeE/YedE family protein [bacterium]